ncbi:hypothetical protein PR048_000984 [Dryococelus australis]|uniref:Uncharacterized protein n=1 Tax=Dryococelus australis TaxID=614101 RepID=A0ABQ9IG39_9NEOP|nr:hypothetical protein PR048_000984 [Dryococelus australis]
MEIQMRRMKEALKLLPYVRRCHSLRIWIGKRTKNHFMALPQHKLKKSTEDSSQEIDGSLEAWTRPDITYAVNMASRKTTNPKIEDVQSFKRIFRYLQGTQNLGLRHSSQENTTMIDAYSDGDYASDTSRRSTSGYIIMYAGGPVLWSTKHQPVVSLSTAESECITASECVKEVLFVRLLYKGLTCETELSHSGLLRLNYCLDVRDCAGSIMIGKVVCYTQD